MAGRNTIFATAWALPWLVATATVEAAPASGHAPDTTQRAMSVENEGADCATAPVVAARQASLPDPFLRADGSRVTTRADWRCQRQQTLHALEQQVYGWKGPAPDS